MKNNNLIKKSITTLLIVLLFATISMVIPQFDMIIDTVYAASNGDIYYSDDGYSDNGESTLVTEIIEYTTKETSSEYKINKSFPAYYNTNSSLTNSCANVAGANIMGYYDRYYENLIPDYVPGILRGSNYSYYQMTVNASKKQDVINELYVRMGTNSPDAGTSQEGYKSGITSYVISKGYNVTYNSVMTGSNLDLNKLRSSLYNGDPVSLYLSGYNITTISDTGNSVNLLKSYFTGNHIMIVYGYETINYYNSSHMLIKSNTYLFVSTGLTTTGYYILNNNGTINDAEAVHIS